MLGHFASLDMIVLEWMSSGGVNWYWYTRNSLLMYTNSTEYFEEDEIKNSFRQYLTYKGIQFL